MKISRRALLKSLTGIGVLSGLGVLLTTLFRRNSLTTHPVHNGEQAASLEQTFRSFIDTLIPSDEMPGAAELGVSEKILEQNKDQVTFMKLVSSGCTWLDQQANINSFTSFTNLDEPERVRIVTLASESRQNSMQYVFFASVRDLSFREYYSDPRSWSGLGYDGPPQPRGFPDYISAPDNTNV